MDPETIDFSTLAARYCARQEITPEKLLERLRAQKVRYSPDGWMLLLCEVFDSSYLGSYTILPYGPNNTFREVPEGPVSPRGLASDTSCVVAILPTDLLPSAHVELNDGRL